MSERMYVHPEDAGDRLADLKAAGASKGIDVELSRFMPRGSAIVFDPDLIKKRFLAQLKEDTERRFLFGGSEITPPGERRSPE